MNDKATKKGESYTCWMPHAQDLTAIVEAAIQKLDEEVPTLKGARAHGKITVTCSEGHENVFEV